VPRVRQMNEPPGARLRVGLSALTAAEYFRDERGRRPPLHRQHLPVHPAGSEVSASWPHPLGGRLPADAVHRDGEPSGADHLHEEGLITSVQAIYVPADDLTDPAPATAFSHLDATTVLSRQIAELGSTLRWTPSTRPRGSSRRWSSGGSLRGRPLGAEGPPEVQGPAGHHRDPRDGRALRGRQDPGRRARRSSGSCRSRSSSPSSSPASRASTCTSRRRSGRSRRSSTASTTSCEQAFYMVGTIEEAIEKGKKLLATV